MDNAHVKPFFLRVITYLNEGKVTLGHIYTVEKQMQGNADGNSYSHRVYIYTGTLKHQKVMEYFNQYDLQQPNGYNKLVCQKM